MIIVVVVVIALILFFLGPMLYVFIAETIDLWKDVFEEIKFRRGKHGNS